MKADAILFRLRSRPLLSACIAAAIGAAGALALGHLESPPPDAAPRPVPARAPLAERGRHFFVQSCAHCHGDDARGQGVDGDGPDLAALRIGNRRIGAVIRGGIIDEMPSFARKYGPADVADLTAYLRTIR